MANLGNLTDMDEQQNKIELEQRLAELTAKLDEAKGKKVVPGEKPRPLWKRITNGVVWTVLCLLTAFVFLFTAVSAIAKAKGDRAEFLGFGIGVVVTGSMEPEIKVGDIILIKRVPQSKIKVGDDITFQTDKVITHRVIEVTEKGFITQGLANNVADGEIPYSNVYGKVILKSAFLGKIYAFVNTQYGFLFVIVVPLFLFVIYQGWSLTKKFKALKSTEDEEKKD